MECNLSTEEVISLNDTKILDEKSQKLLKKYIEEIEENLNKYKELLN